MFHSKANMWHEQIKVPWSSRASPSAFSAGGTLGHPGLSVVQWWPRENKNETLSGNLVFLFAPVWQQGPFLSLSFQIPSLWTKSPPTGLSWAVHPQQHLHLSVGGSQGSTHWTGFKSQPPEGSIKSTHVLLHGVLFFKGERKKKDSRYMKNPANDHGPRGVHPCKTRTRVSPEAQK